MIVKENTTIYLCEHCRKVYQLERFVIKHEAGCRKNPNNQHKCFQFCQHLEKQSHQVFNDDFEYGSFLSRTEFYCKKLNKYMHSFLAERINNPFLSESIGETERMPLECEDYVHDDRPTVYNQ